MEREVRFGSRLGQICQGEGGEVRCGRCEGEGLEEGSARGWNGRRGEMCECVEESGHGEAGEERSGGGREGLEGEERRRLRKLNSDELYKYFVDRLHTGQLANIPYRAIRSQKTDPKWMTVRLKHYIGMKRGIYKRLKAGEEVLRPQYIELVRTVRKLTRKAKNNYEIKIASQVKTNPKGFFQNYRTKNRESIGPLKTANGELVSSGEEISKILNEYFLTVFTQENMQEMPVSEQMFRANDNEKLIDIFINKEIVEQEIDRLKKFKSPGPDEVYPRVLKECKEIISEPLASVFRKSLDTGELPLMWR